MPPDPPCHVWRLAIPAPVQNWLKSYLEPYGEVRRAGLTLEQLVERNLPERRQAALRRLGFLLLRPDSLRSGAAPAIVAHLQERHAIQPLRLRVLHVRPWLFERLYRYKMHLWGDNVWLHHRIFAQGPAAALLVGGVGEGAASLSEWLDRAKGPSAAIAAANLGQLRGRFDRQSSFHALVHCAEDPGALLYESTLFFPWTAVREAVQAVSAGNANSPAALPMEMVETLLSGEPGSPGSTSPSVFDVLLRTKQRIIAALMLNRQAVECRERLDRLRQQIGACRRRIAGRPYLEQRAAFMEFAASERPGLEALIREYEEAARSRSALRSRRWNEISCGERWQLLNQAAAGLQLLYASWHLSGHEVYTLDDGQELFRLLGENDVPVSPWERTLIQSALRADANRDARWGDEPLFPAP